MQLGLTFVLNCIFYVQYKSISSNIMANQTFTNLPTNDKQFAALQLPPKAPTSNKNKPNVSEGHEILFQARNVMKTDENPSLVFHGDEQVLQHPNSPNKVEDLAQATNPKTEAQLKR